MSVCMSACGGGEGVGGVSACEHKRTEEPVNYCDRESKKACHISPQVVLTKEGDLHEEHDGRIRGTHQVQRHDCALK